MDKKLLLSILLVSQTVALLVYTFFAFQNEGANLFQIFISNITSLTWNGQFNLDFSCYLTLSGLWIMWRNKYNIASVLMGLASMIFGYNCIRTIYAVFVINRKRRPKENTCRGQIKLSCHSYGDTGSDHLELNIIPIA